MSRSAPTPVSADAPPPARLLLDDVEFWDTLAADIAAARERVYVQTLSFEGDSVGTRLAEAMKASSAKDRRIIVDRFTRFFINDRFVYGLGSLFDKPLRAEVRATRAMVADLQANGVKVCWVNPMGLFLRKITARNHKKMIICDDTGYIGGNNFSEHNFSWHDLMLRTQHSQMVAFLANDFAETWDGRNSSGDTALGQYEMLMCCGKSNADRFDRVRQLIASASEEIFVESPYLTYPVMDWLIDASNRGVRVTIVTADKNNWGPLQVYMQWKAQHGDIEVRGYQRKFTHLKAMLIDRETLILGSSNFDIFSYRSHQELLAVITEPDVVAEFRERVMDADVRDSVAFSGRVGNVRGHLAQLTVKLAAGFMWVLRWAP